MRPTVDLELRHARRMLRKKRKEKTLLCPRRHTLKARFKINSREAETGMKWMINFLFINCNTLLFERNSDAGFDFACAGINDEHLICIEIAVLARFRCRYLRQTSQCRWRQLKVTIVSKYATKYSVRSAAEYRRSHHLVFFFFFFGFWKWKAN